MPDYTEIKGRMVRSEGTAIRIDPASTTAEGDEIIRRELSLYPDEDRTYVLIDNHTARVVHTVQSPESRLNEVLMATGSIYWS